LRCEVLAGTAGETTFESVVPLKGEYIRHFDLEAAEKARLQSVVLGHEPLPESASIIDSLQEQFPYEDFRLALWREVPEFLLFREEVVCFQIGSI
jgi:hypothetical protein